MICNSPSQVYHLALPFCPSSSWLRKCYATELSQEVKVKGLSAEWGDHFRTVTLDYPRSLACWKDTIAVGLDLGDIVTLDGITGIQVAILSRHTAMVNSLAFLPDGTSLVSGSDDKTIKLWDVQTGGIVKTFCGHTKGVLSISISADCTTIASGSEDKRIRLWNIQTEECYCIIKQQVEVNHVRFSPTDPQYLVSASADKIWHWDINGHQTKPAHKGLDVSFSLDGTQLVVCRMKDIVVQSSSSGEIMAKFHVSGDVVDCCCFSPDGKHVAIVVDGIINVLEATSPHPHPIKTFDTHSNDITSLVFSSPSCLISLSDDGLIKFWPTGALQTAAVVADPEPVPLTSAEILSITLQAKDGVAISSDSEGVVKTWDISTGLCKATFQTPAKDHDLGDARLIDNQLIFVWYVKGIIWSWNVKKGMPLLTTINVILNGDNGDDNSDDDRDDCDSDDGRDDWNSDDDDYSSDGDPIDDVKISEDGSKVFCLTFNNIQAWFIQTGEVVAKVELKHDSCRSLTVDCSSVWVHSSLSEPQGWDFGIPGSPPVQLSNSSLVHSNGAMVWDSDESRIKDVVTGRVAFQMEGRFTDPVKSQWDGQYLVVGYGSGEVLILEFNHGLLQ